MVGSFNKSLKSPGSRLSRSSPLGTDAALTAVAAARAMVRTVNFIFKIRNCNYKRIVAIKEWIVRALKE